VAFEIALQLQRLGEAVAFVGLFDTMSPLLMREWSWETDAEIVAGMAHEAAEENGRPLSLGVEELEGLDLAAQIRRASEALRAQGAVPPEFHDEDLEGAVRSVRDRITSGSAYEPGRFQGALTLFRASVDGERHDRFFASRGEEERRFWGWSPLATEPVEVHVVPGSHVTLASEPHVGVLARRLREALAAARERAAASTLGPNDLAA
jgi:thioesterase domain-containing protein